MTIALAEPDQANIYYIGWSLGGPLDAELLEAWRERIEPVHRTKSGSMGHVA